MAKMKTVVIITALLWYANNPIQMQTDWPGGEFETLYECREFLQSNKVMLTLGLFEKHLEDDKGNHLLSWEYFCESRSYTDL